MASNILLEEGDPRVTSAEFAERLSHVDMSHPSLLLRPLESHGHGLISVNPCLAVSVAVTEDLGAQFVTWSES